MSEMQAVNSTELGALPPTWRVQRFDSLFIVQQGKQVSKKNRVGENQRAFLRTKNVFWGRLDLSDLDEMHFSEAEEKRLALKSGDLLICEGGDIGRTAIWREGPALCYYQNHLHRARPRNEAGDSQFALYWLWYAFEIGSVYFGRGNVTTIPNLSQSKLCELPLPVPPLSEQRKIAGVMGVVQRAIEQQERLVALTAELKKGLLHQLFTKGLRGEPKKQTEIGSVPESWQVVRLQEVCRFLSGGTPSKQRPDFWEGDIPWVSPKDMKQPRLNDVADHISESALRDGSALAPAGSVFVVVRGMILAKEVPVALAEIPMAFNQDMKAIIPGPRIMPSFLLYAMAAFKQKLFYKVGRSAHGTMTLMSSEIANFAIPLPDKVTQETIATAIETVRTKASAASTQALRPHRPLPHVAAAVDDCADSGHLIPISGMKMAFCCFWNLKSSPKRPRLMAVASSSKRTAGAPKWLPTWLSRSVIRIESSPVND
jgi:type I restriction enzyme S subunit